MSNLTKEILNIFDYNSLAIDNIVEESNYNAELDPDDLSNNVSYNALPMFRAKSIEDKKTAPELAYTAVYNHAPKIRMFFSNYNEKKIWKNLLIDKYIDESVLDKIDTLPKVASIRAVCQGHSKDRPTYIVLRTTFQEEKDILSCLKKLENHNHDHFYKLIHSPGNSGYYRLCAAGNTFYNEQNENKNTIYHQWWDNLYDFLSIGLK